MTEPSSCWKFSRIADTVLPMARGQTYFVYHDGSLPHGSGFRRVACCEKFSINEDGSIDYIRKTATGLTGTLSRITDMNGDYVAAKSFENTLNDSDYPMLNKSLRRKRRFSVFP